MKRLLSILLLTFVLTSCVSTGFTRTGPSYPSYQGVVKIFYELPNDLDFERIGIVTAEESSAAKMSKVMRKMQEEAAKNGANAIIIRSESSSSKGTLSGGSGSSSVQNQVSATAIRIIN
jgi:uncharacterized protein YbjQ (UPF0145 family)